MKKLTLILALFSLFISNNVMAQSSHPSLFNKQSKHLRVGVGINSSGMPIEISYDQGFKQSLFGVEKLNFGLGGYLGYYGSKDEMGVWTDGHTFGYKYSHIVLGVRGLFHYPLVSNIDTYAGLMLGYNIASSKFYGNGTDPGSASAGGLSFGGVIGARYQFNNKWGMYAEAGYSIAYLSIGLVYCL